jgi:hypothetical protein
VVTTIVNSQSPNRAIGHTAASRRSNITCQDRIARAQFRENQDFVIVEDLSSPNPASSKARAQFKESVDYIVENVDRQIGRTTKSMVYAGVKTAIEYHLSQDRIARAQFKEHVDFVAELDSPNPASQVGHGGRRNLLAKSGEQSRAALCPKAPLDVSP